MKERINFVLSKLGKEKKKRRRIIAIVLVLVILVAAVGRMCFWKKTAGGTKAKMAVQSAVAQTGNISTTVVGTGTIQGGSAKDITIPAGIEIEKILVQAGETVEKGQNLATVNEASVAAKLLEVQENLDEVKEEIDDLSEDAETEGTTEYLESLVLKGEKKNLKATKNVLNALLDTKSIQADQAGIIDTIYVEENAETENTVSTSETDDTSASATVKETTTDVTKERTILTASNLMAVKSNALNLQPIQGTLLSSETQRKTEIEACNLSVVAPVVGSTPQTVLYTSEGFSGTISWNCSNSVFQGDTVYTATIILTAQEGYSFSSAVSVNIAGTTKIQKSGDDEVLTITASFPKTEAENTSSTEESRPSEESNSNALENSTDNNTDTSAENTQTTESTTTEEKKKENSANAEKSETSSTEDKDGEKNTQSTLRNAEGQGENITSGKTSGTSVTESVSSQSSGNSNSTSSEGENSLNETSVFSIVSESEAVVTVNVDELDILSVKEGQTATITLDAVEEEEYEGTITAVSTIASSEGSSAKYPVEITMEKTEDMIFGMSASATIQIEEATNAILIPVNALQEEGNSTFVYTEQAEDGTLSGEKEVTTGLSDGSQVAITEGLTDGDTVYYWKAGTSSEGESARERMENGDRTSGNQRGFGTENAGGQAHGTNRSGKSQ